MFHYVNALISREKKMKPFWIANIILAFFIVGVIVAWLFGTVEQRNRKINSTIKSSYDKQVDENYLREKSK